MGFEHLSHGGWFYPGVVLGAGLSTFTGANPGMGFGTVSGAGPGMGLAWGLWD